MLTTNTLLKNKYQLGSQLDQGDTETLYRAVDMQSNRPVTIIQIFSDKKLEADALAELRQQLRQEANVLTRLKHANLAGVIEFFEEGDEAYLVTEHIEGEDLASRIGRAGQLPEFQVITWADQLLAALTYCHNQSILHRDIKPEHIIIQPNGQAVLGGFGLIKWRPSSSPVLGKTEPVTGTAPYASPEQYAMRSLQELDDRSDLYNLGATLYHALAGQPPPAAAARSNLSVSAASLYESITGQKLPSAQDKVGNTSLSIRNHNPAVSEAAEAAIIQAMAMDRSDRYPDAKTMRLALPEPTVAEKGVPVWAWGVVAAILAFGVVGGGWWALLSSGTPSTSSTGPTTEMELAVASASSTPVAVAPPSPTDTSSPPNTAAPITTATDTATPLPTGAATPFPADTVTATPAPTDMPTATSTPAVIPDITIPGIPADYVRARAGDRGVMVYVPAGEFVMGSSPADGEDNEHPQHIVTLDAFWIDIHETTNAQFATFLNEAGNQTEGGTSWLITNDEKIHIRQEEEEWVPTPGFENHPVVGVTWYGARAYCLWYGARLPTEAEWEKAARGTNGQLYPWGDASPTCELGNYWVEESCVGATTPVGSYVAGRSPFGALDMAGNVWEWVSDWYDQDYYSTSAAVNPMGPRSGSTRVIRSGSWNNPAPLARAGFRGFFHPASINYNVGFRCAQD